MLQCSSQIEAEIVSSRRHGRNWIGGNESGIVARREDFCQHNFLLLWRDHVQPDAKDVRVLAEVLLRGRVREQSVLLVPAEFQHGL